jgi:hypothetical protein
MVCITISKEHDGVIVADVLVVNDVVASVVVAIQLLI